MNVELRDSPKDVLRNSFISPLRYPGGKRRLLPFIKDTLQLNQLRPKLFVEPFAGGASVSLELLAIGAVEQIALGELDPLVASFWKVVFEDPAWLLEQISRIPVTVEQWLAFKKGKFSTDRERALVCLFLNRTSYSGILSSTGGPIGGYSQQSKYTISCRFNREMLIQRIRDIHELGKSRVLFVKHATWKETIEEVEKLGYRLGEVFYYLDPPFYRKAEKLYRFYFREEDHRELHDFLMTLRQPWLLSYDAAEPIYEMYSRSGNGTRRLSIMYSLSVKGKATRAQELMITNLPKLPKGSQLRW